MNAKGQMPMYNCYDEPKGGTAWFRLFSVVLFFFFLCLWYIIFQSNYDARGMFLWTPCLIE